MSVRRWATAGGLALLLAASGAIAATTPTTQEWQRSFAVDAPLGERAEGRNIAGTVSAAHLADAVETARWQSGEGSLWVVVDASVESVIEPATLAHTLLRVGDRSFSASDRLGSSTLRGAALTPGIPMRGALVFELPADALDDPGAARAELQLGVGIDVRLDSVLTTTLDLTTLDREPVTIVEDTIWGRG